MMICHLDKWTYCGGMKGEMQMESHSTSSTASRTAATGRGLGIALWAAQIALAIVFALAGGMKVSTPAAELAKMAPGFPLALIRFIGIAEPLTCYSRRPASLSSDASHMFQDFSKMLDTTLLADLSGLRRWLWRRRIISYQAYSAAMTARASIERDIEMRFLVRSLLQWPSPFWQPKRYLSLVVTLKRRMRPGLATERNKCS